MNSDLSGVNPLSTLLESNVFTVVDVETTGLFPGGHDRVVEIAALRIDIHGNVLDEYSTLVNPERDIGASEIHGIAASDVVYAPRFDEIAGDILGFMRDSIVVGHNVNFDLRFISAELGRCGIWIPDHPYICTMLVAKLADPDIPGRKLGVCCDYFGISLNNAHCATDDARATAMLFSRSVERLRAQGVQSLTGLGLRSFSGQGQSWPLTAASGKAVRRGEQRNIAAEQGGLLADLVSDLPATNVTEGEFDEYFGLLDRVLEDRNLAGDEAAALLIMAMELNLSQQAIARAHQLYLEDLVRLAYEDRQIVAAEEQDLRTVQRLLGVSDPAYEALVARVCENDGASEKDACTDIGDSPDLTGQNVCFTGEFHSVIDGQRISRAVAEELAKSKGLNVRSSVSKKLDILVLADPNSMSTKARKARDCNVRIVEERNFWRMLGFTVA